MDHELTQDEQQAIETAARFARDEVAPHAARWEIERTMPLDVLRATADIGLTGLLVPRQHGGRGLGITATARVMEELSAADMAFAFSLVVHNNLMGAIAANGDATQRQRYLPAMQRFDTIGAFLLTEPGGGSDAAAITTTARRDGENWVLDGAKSWCTNAAHADVLSVYAQTDPARGWRGIACFLVDADISGVVREAPYVMLGGHAMGAGSFRFDGCRVGADALLVPPGEGFKAALAGIDFARSSVAAMCCGMLRAGLDCALAYIAKRPAFGQTVADFQGMQWQLADVATDLHAARLMAYAATQAIDRDGSAPLEAAHAKKFATRATFDGLVQCMQALGANGLTHDHPLARHLAMAKVAQYLDGTTEIQNVVISRAMLKPYVAR